jgi:hypothetical protein
MRARPRVMPMHAGQGVDIEADGSEYDVHVLRGQRAAASRCPTNSPASEAGPGQVQPHGQDVARRGCSLKQAPRGSAVLGAASEAARPDAVQAALARPRSTSPVMSHGPGGPPGAPLAAGATSNLSGRVPPATTCSSTKEARTHASGRLPEAQARSAPDARPRDSQALRRRPSPLLQPDVSAVVRTFEADARDGRFRLAD